jgi:TRAP transporter TAXI family solute receptor
MAQARRVTALLALSASGLLACNPGGAPDDIKVLTIGTHGVGSIVHAMGAGIASVLSAHLPIEAKVVAASGPMEWMPMMATGEIDLGVVNSWDAQAGRQGRSTYGRISGGRGFALMLVASGRRALNGVVVADGAGIVRGQDLKGRRYVGTYTGSPAVTAQALAALANFGLTPRDVEMVPAPSPDAGVRAVIEERAEANGASNIGMGVISELDATRGARFLSFDPSPDAVARLQAEFPGRLVKVGPGPGRTGVRGEVYLLSYDFYLVARQALPAALVAEILRILWDHNAALTKINVPLRDWTPDRFVTTSPSVPYHPGAIRFYSERGAWPAGDASPSHP